MRFCNSPTAGTTFFLCAIPGSLHELQRHDAANFLAEHTIIKPAAAKCVVHPLIGRPCPCVWQKTKGSRRFRQRALSVLCYPQNGSDKSSRTTVRGAAW